VVRVLIVAPAPLGEARIGGIVNFIRGFVQFMPADFEAEIVGVAVGAETPGAHWQEITFAGRKVRFLPVARLSQARRSGLVPVKARIVAGMIRHRRKISVAGRVAQVHAPGMDRGLIGRKVPIIRVVHNDPADLAANSRESTWRRLGWGLRLTERLTFKSADRVFFVNRASLAQYSSAMPDAAERMSFVGNGIDPVLFHSLSDEDRLARRRRLAAALQLPADDSWLIFAGRLDPQKDPLLLLRAFDDYARRGAAQPAHLLLVGDGHLRADCEKLAAELGIANRTHFLGVWPRERLADLLRVSDAFVLASAFEAAPFVVFEALASGVPVVSTAVGEVPSLVHHEQTGWIAADRTPAALADGIKWALEQPRAEIAAKAEASMSEYHLANVLAPFYQAHRELAHG
jgi:glycosyltransferase involved in cell wall biosynthesis